jgi:hypothetical protein
MFLVIDIAVFVALGLLAFYLITAVNTDGSTGSPSG